VNIVFWVEVAVCVVIMPVVPRRLAALQLELTQLRIRHNILMLALVEAAREEEEEGGHRPRSVWVKPWLQRRTLYGQYDTLMFELMRESHGDFKKFMRVTPEIFRELLERVGPRITKDRARRQALEAGIKLAITLRFLATGNSYRSLAFGFRVASNTISLFIPQVCDAIVDEYRQECLVTPTTVEEWRRIAEVFEKRWNFPHCVGAIDGKHVALKKPGKSGSRFFNHKGFFSIVLLAVVDGDYKFLWVNVGSEGSCSDAGIFNRSSLAPALQDATLGLPQPDHLPHDDVDIPYFLVGDDAFALRTYMMKPFPQYRLTKEERIFNYRASRARRVSENAFGIMACRFRVLLTTIQTNHLHGRSITKACIVLHNVLRSKCPQLQNRDLDQEDEHGNIVPGAWRDVGHMAEMDAAGRASRATRDGKRQRIYLKNYLSSDAGSVPWQDAAIGLPAANQAQGNQ